MKKISTLPNDFVSNDYYYSADELSCRVDKLYIHDKIINYTI